MCFHPNLVSAGKFQGSLEKRIKFRLDGTPNTKEQQRAAEKLIKQEIRDGITQLVPCGQCLQCRIQYAANWAARCECEIGYHENSYFITLTYDDQHVPVHNMATLEDYKGIRDPIEYVQGKTVERLSLRKKDMQDFLKRLRDHCNREEKYDNAEEGLMVYYCGEYGDTTARPHYHAIIYGFKIPDLKHHYSKKGYMHFTSEWLSNIWKNGLIDIGSVTYESCQYTARYVIKKRKGPKAKEWYQERGIEPEFVQMSLKPGIGYRYWNDHRDEIYSIDKLYLAAGRKQTPPRFFDMKEDKLWCYIEGKLNEAGEIIDAESVVLQKVESDQMREIKRARRKRANDRLFAELEKTTKGMLAYMEAKETAFENNHKQALNRGAVDAE